MLEEGQLQIFKLFPRVKTRYVEEEEIKIYNLDGMLFFNVNTQKDYLWAQRKAASIGSY
ncbi:MAG: hypothetical protein ACE5PV_01030 [Candidatus Poribacteria bacterium]